MLSLLTIMVEIGDVVAPGGAPPNPPPLLNLTLNIPTNVLDPTLIKPYSNYKLVKPLN
jgi:hypothetical protein